MAETLSTRQGKVGNISFWCLVAGQPGELMGYWLTRKGLGKLHLDLCISLLHFNSDLNEWHMPKKFLPELTEFCFRLETLGNHFHGNLFVHGFNQKE